MRKHPQRSTTMDEVLDSSEPGQHGLASAVSGHKS